MTSREEEKIIAARERADRHEIAEMELYKGDKYNYSYARIYNTEIASFEAGVEWADKNPQSLWISVKDDLPCNNHNFIHFGFTNRVLVRNKNGDLFVAYMKKNKDNEWIWCNDTDDKFDLLSDITYWMPIPKLSK